MPTLTPADLSRFLADSQDYPSWYRLYRFPNGHTASVILDPRPENLFRFEIESSDPDDLGRGGLAINLTTAEVEAKLAKVAGLPLVDEN